MHRTALVWLVALGVLGGGCTTGPAVPAPSPPVSPTAPSGPAPNPPASASATPTPAPEEPFADLDQLVLTEPGSFGPGWSELFALPYGDAPEQLGTSLGGEDLQWGPSYGTQIPDGSWWFLDTAHRRLAHYSETGSYLGEIRIPERYLAGGEYVQYAAPIALSDGTVVLQSTTIDDPAMLLLAPDGGLARVELPSFFAVKGTDGSHLYGFSEQGDPVQVDPRQGTITDVDAFAGQAIAGYNLSVTRGRLGLTLPEVTLDLPVKAAGRETSTVYLNLEAAAGADGVLNLLVSGMIEDEPGEITDVTGFVRINPAGRGLIESVPLLTSPSDPGDGLRLGVRLGDSRPWLMVIDSDAVRVYRRTG